MIDEVEATFRAVVDPYARADFFFAFGPDGVEVEESYITFPTLPGGLLMKAGKRHALFVICAARRVDSTAIRRQLGVSKLRFVSADELHELTGLVPGEVPPFGEPILPFPLYADESVFENDRIAFNAGTLTDSIIMSVLDWETVANPHRIRFSK